MLTALMMEAVSISETSVNSHQTTRLNSPEDIFSEFSSSTMSSEKWYYYLCIVENLNSSSTHAALFQTLEKMVQNLCSVTEASL
jgi:hypothetical protein